MKEEEKEEEEGKRKDMRRGRGGRKESEVKNKEVLEKEDKGVKNRVNTITGGRVAKENGKQKRENKQKNNESVNSEEERKSREEIIDEINQIRKNT